MYNEAIVNNEDLLIENSEEFKMPKAFQSINVKITDIENQPEVYLRKSTQTKNEMKRLLKESEQTAISKHPKRQQLYKLYKLIVNRKKFQYYAFHGFEEYFRCLCFKSKSSLKRHGKVGKRHLYFRKATERLNHDLDISGMLQVRHGFEILKSILFDEEDHILQSFQRRLVIDSETGDMDFMTDYERQ